MIEVRSGVGGQGATLQTVQRAAIRALITARGGELEIHLGMEVPYRCVRARAGYREIFGIDFVDSLRSDDV